MCSVSLCAWRLLTGCWVLCLENGGKSIKPGVSLSTSSGAAFWTFWLETGPLRARDRLPASSEPELFGAGLSPLGPPAVSLFPGIRGGWGLCYLVTCRVSLSASFPCGVSRSLAYSVPVRASPSFHDSARWWDDVLPVSDFGMSQFRASVPADGLQGEPVRPRKALGWGWMGAAIKVCFGFGDVTSS